MKTIRTDRIPTEQIDALGEFAASGVGPEMRDLLQSVIDCVRAGDDLAAVSQPRHLARAKPPHGSE